MGLMELMTLDALEAGLPEICRAPSTGGSIELIVRRPKVSEREVIEEAQLDPVMGLVGDCWLTRGSRLTPDGSAHPGMQLTLMSSRAKQRCISTRTGTAGVSSRPGGPTRSRNL